MLYVHRTCPAAVGLIPRVGLTPAAVGLTPRVGLTPPHWD